MTEKVEVIANPEAPSSLSAVFSFHGCVGCMLVRHRGSYAVHEDLHLKCVSARLGLRSFVLNVLYGNIVLHTERTYNWPLV